MNSGSQVGGNDCCSTATELNNPCPASNKLEPPNLPEFICCPKLCTIFGGHDTNEYPETDTFRSPCKHKHINLNTLGSPIGLVKSSFVIKSTGGKQSEIQMHRYATYLKAFAKIFLIPENEWSTETIDLIFREGQQLVTESRDYRPEHNAEYLSHIYSDTESKINRSFDMHGYSFQLELNEKFQLNPNDDEYISDATIIHIRPALKAFFRQFKYCFLKMANWYLLIWKARGVYFVFDFYGRRATDFGSDREKGFAMLICLKALENVCHLVGNLSGLQESDVFNIREMKIVKLTGPDGKTISREYGNRINEYEIINFDYAYLKAVLHLTKKKTDPLRMRSALPVGVAALISSKIDHPATWNQKVLDKIICYGVNVCRCCWEQCLRSGDLIEFDHFPNQLKIGQYYASFVLTPRTYVGVWKCVPKYKMSELAMAVEKSFTASDNYILVQVDYQIYALWKKNGFIYMFDPYRHRIAINIPGESTDNRSATLRMFRSMDTFFTVFTQILLESNRTTTFYIHRLQVKRIDPVMKAEGVPPLLDATIDQDSPEIKSLNETICFEEDEGWCMDKLFEISESEEEDDLTGVVELDMKEPKSETDEPEELEEEEGGLEDIGEVESSSSGDDGAHSNKKNKKKGKGKKISKGDKKDKKSKGKKKGKGKSSGDGPSDENINKTGKSKSKSKNIIDKSTTKRTKSEKSDDNNERKKKKPEATNENEKNKNQDKVGESNKSSIESTKDANNKLGDIKNKLGDDKNKLGESNISNIDYNDEQIEEDDKFECPVRPISQRPNHYPGYSSIAQDMAVVGSESGTYESICKLLRAGFKCADRILTMTPWGNYVVFRSYDMFEKIYFLFDGCTCNVNRFRHLNLNCGTAGLLCFQSLHDVICYIIDSQKIRTGLNKSKKNIVDEICREYCR